MYNKYILKKDQYIYNTYILRLIYIYYTHTHTHIYIFKLSDPDPTFKKHNSY